MVMDCESIRQAYIKVGVIVVKDNEDAFVEDARTPDAIAKECDTLFRDDGKYGLPESILKKKMKGGGLIGTLLDKMTKPADREAMVKQLREQYEDEIAKAKSAPAPRQSSPRKPRTAHPAEPPVEKTEEEKVQELAESNDPALLCKATHWLVEHTDENDTDAVRMALEALKPIVEWYNKHAKRGAKKR
jgi:hypothetical protein